MNTSFCQRLENIQFNFENFYAKPGQVVYYIRPDKGSYKGFFMEQNRYNEWKVVHRQIVPPEILNIEKLLAMVICQHQ